MGSPGSFEPIYFSTHCPIFLLPFIAKMMDMTACVCWSHFLTTRSLLHSQPSPWNILPIFRRHHWQSSCEAPSLLTSFDSRKIKSLLFLLGILGTSCCCSVTKSCPTLFDPMDCSPPGSSVHGILQARILQWVAISFSNAKVKVMTVYSWWGNSGSCR